ncbi:MAG: transposase, partial [Erysipelotrichaceae bacterium]|nr:transposase [Erysipelotrichaceae bacterium]
MFRTYLSIYESFYSPDVKGTKHRSFKKLGNLDTLIASEIDDPISFFKKEVDKLNQERKLNLTNSKIN